MAQSATASARPSASADDQRRDDEAWNLPRRSAETAGHATTRDGLDWTEFVDAYFPGSRRHNLAAVASYGAYRRAQVVGDQTSSLR
jgi:hypothetical protein